MQFGDVDRFLHQEEVGSPATLAKLRSILSDPNKNVYLQIELASVVDYGRTFVTATYKLEGDGPLVFSCFEVMEEIQATVRTGYTPNLDAVAQKLSTSSPHRQPQLKAYASKCIQPGLDYFNRQISTILQEAVSAFKAARWFLPTRVQVMRATANCVDSLSIFPFLGSPQVIRTTGRTSFVPSQGYGC